jgi:hypothetical protein
MNTALLAVSPVLTPPIRMGERRLVASLARSGALEAQQHVASRYRVSVRRHGPALCEREEGKV